MTTTDAARGPRGSRYVVWLIVSGALVSVAGLVFGLVAKSLAEQSALGSHHIPTLPLYVYTQYTQRSSVPDYFGLWAGLVVAGIGLGIVVAGAVLAFAMSRGRSASRVA